MTREARIVAAVLLAVLAAAVVYGALSTTGQETALQESLEGVTLPSGSRVPLDAAVDDLADRLGLDRGAIEVLSVEQKTWSDTSLGCPEPGKTYAQVMTPGFLIHLKAGGRTYEYHASTSQALLCDNQ